MPEIPEEWKRNDDTARETQRPARVTVTDVAIPFGSMVWLMVKFALAAIPAAIILIFIGAFIMALLASAGMNFGL